MAGIGPLVSVRWLQAHLDDPGVQIVDASWFMPGDGRTGAQSYAEGHIPGAIFFDIDALSDKTVDLPHMLPTPEAFAADAGALGLRREATVVVYDALGIFSAPRVWWTLRVMGFPDVTVLDGGLKAWRAAGLPVSTEPVALAATTLTPSYDASLVRSIETVQAALSQRDAHLVDARPAARFQGEVPEPRPGLRSGHMPGAHNVPWSELINADGTMEAPSEVRTIFKRGGVSLHEPIIATCGSGVSAAVLALALATVGKSDVPIYDGSWSEWGSRPDTAIITGA